ncbi:SDR family oxidoreductase [Streptomyces sp. PmtG]
MTATGPDHGTAIRAGAAPGRSAAASSAGGRVGIDIGSESKGPGSDAHDERGGSVVFVTGASRGLGRATAAELLCRGHKVAFCARGRGDLAQAARELRPLGPVLAMVGDVSEPGTRAAMLERAETTLGPVTALINNAGQEGPIGPLWQVDPQQWWDALTGSLRSAAFTSAAALPRMTARGSGRIINVASHAGVATWPNLSSYSVAKTAMIKLGENLAAETVRHRVTVLNFHPGLLEPGLAARHLTDPAPEHGPQAQVAAWLHAQVAAGRTTALGDAVAALCALVEGAADHRSGAYLTTDDIPPAGVRTSGPEVPPRSPSGNR